MNNETEYIKLFQENRSLIDAPCSTLLNEHRSAAFEKFASQGFPTIKEEAYRNSNVSKLFTVDYGINLGRINVTGIEDSFICDVPNLATRRELIVNDIYKSQEREDWLPEGVLLGSLNKYAVTHAHLITPYYNTLACKGDNIAQFNTAFVQDGLLLYIPRNIELSETIQLVTLLRADIEMMSNRRILVILEDGAKANLLVCDHSSNEKATLSTQITEVFLGNGASLNLFELEETGSANSRMAHLFVKQSADSHFNHSCITLTGGFTRNGTYVSLEGEGAEVNLSGLAICDKQQHTDNHTLVEHKVGRCTSNELYKYVLDEQSTGVFAGKMHIHPDAQHTTSQQTNRNLCLTSCARMYAQPQLEIYADDVKCSHGSTVGQLDENALFYMQQRGIPKEEARHLLMFAFAGEVIENINIDALRDRLHILVEKRFRGELNRCKGCALCKQ